MEPPTPPDEADCCNSGCSPCIFDVYESKLKKFKDGGTKPCPSLNCIEELKYTAFVLTQIEPHTGTSYFYTFRCSEPKSEDATIHMNPGQHFLLKAEANGDIFTRAYTPIKFEGSIFTVLVKIYKVGMMSKYLQRLKVNVQTYWRGPYGDYQIKIYYKYALFIAQGTGIAPFYTIIKQMLDNEDCDTMLKLFYCCKNCDDIFLQDDLIDFSRYWNFSYEVFISENIGIRSKYKEVVHKEKLNQHFIQDYLENKQVVQTLICGSGDFTNHFKEITIHCGISEKDIYIF